MLNWYNKWITACSVAVSHVRTVLIFLFCRGARNFSSCSAEDFEKLTLNKGGSCLLNIPRPDETYSVPYCGNKLVDAGEDCDCGSQEVSNSSCCCSVRGMRRFRLLWCHLSPGLSQWKSVGLEVTSIPLAWLWCMPWTSAWLLAFLRELGLTMVTGVMVSRRCIGVGVATAYTCFSGILPAGMTHLQLFVTHHLLVF